MNDIEVLENIKTEEELYKYIINRATDKLPLEHEIFAIRNNDFHDLDYAIYVDGYISLDVIIRNIKKQEELEKLLKERQSDKERIKELEEERDEIYEDYQYLGEEKWKSDEAVIFLTKRLENTIPTSLIIEKIEEYKAKTDCRYCNNSCDSYAVCKVLEELLNGKM